MATVRRRGFLRLIPVLTIVVAWCGVFAAQGESPDKRTSTFVKASAEQPPSSGQATSDLAVQLVCDARVQAELKLTSKQVRAIELQFENIEQSLWPLRDTFSGPHAAERTKLTQSMEDRLGDILDANQLLRVQQLVLRAQGWPAINTPAVAAQLKLSSDQARRVGAIVDDARAKMQQVFPSSADPPARKKSVFALREREGSAIQQLLSAAQRQRLAELVGSPYDLASVAPLSYRAAELKTSRRMDQCFSAKTCRPAWQGGGFSFLDFRLH